MEMLLWTWYSDDGFKIKKDGANEMHTGGFGAFMY